MTEEKNLTEKSEPDAELDIDSKDLVDPAVCEIVENVIKYTKSDRKQKFHLYRMFNLPTNVCARLCNYSVDYGYKLVAEYRNKPNHRQMVERIINDMPEAYRAVCKLRLVQVAEIEGHALQKYQAKPQLAIDKPQLLKAIKQAGGIDLNEVGLPGQPTINIKSIENLQILVGDAAQKRLESINE